MKSGTQDGQYKDKYLASLAQLESLEASLAQAEERLRKAVSRLSAAATGAHPRLDEKLDELRRAVRRQNSGDTVDLILDAIGSQVSEIERKISADTEDGIEKLVAKIRFGEEGSGRANELTSRLRLATSAAERTPLLDELARLINAAISESGAVARKSAAIHEERIAAAAILLELLSDLQVDDKHRPLVIDLTRRVQAANSEDELRAVTADIAALIANRLDPSVVPPPVRGTADVLVELLNCIPFPAEMTGSVEALRERLDKGVNPEDWAAVLAAIADLIAQMRARIEAEKSDLENFLRELTERLTEMDEVLRHADVDRQAARDSGRAMDAVMREQVQGIEVGVRAATSLDQLKQVVSERLNHLQQQMASHRREEESRQARLEEKLKHLAGKLKTAEGESEQLRQHLRKRRYQAMSDPLTGVANRMAYDERLSKEYSRWKRYQEPLALIVLDVDHFKSINDKYGHKAGDRALKLIAGVVRSALRETDFLARYGGEEFVALLPNTDIRQAVLVSEKLRLAIENSDFQHHNKRVPITISLGVAAFRAGDTAEAVFIRADDALYRAKAGGRNRHAVETTNGSAGRRDS